jgi:hypothetical protein
LNKAGEIRQELVVAAFRRLRRGAIDDNETDAGRIALEKHQQVLKLCGSVSKGDNMGPIRFTVDESYFSSSPSTQSGGVNGAESSGADVQQVIVTVVLVEPGLSDGKQIQIISNEMMSDDVNPLE